MEFREIPPGCFRMGSRGESSAEEPRHWVQLMNPRPGEPGSIYPFFLGTFPVTQLQFAVGKAEHKNGSEGFPDHPAENMDWEEASSFCEWVTGQCRAQLNADARTRHYVAGLPTEAQWEYACRAGTETEYYLGDGDGALREAGWFYGNQPEASTQPVGMKSPNGFGLHDMHGNVEEWCRDFYDANAYKKRVDGVCDPEVPRAPKGEQNPARVARGGSWVSDAWYCRSAYRFGGYPWDRGWGQGFRVCLFPGPVSEQASAAPRPEMEGGVKPTGIGGLGRSGGDWEGVHLPPVPEPE